MHLLAAVVHELLVRKSHVSHIGGVDLQGRAVADFLPPLNDFWISSFHRGGGLGSLVGFSCKIVHRLEEQRFLRRLLCIHVNETVICMRNKEREIQ